MKTGYTKASGYCLTATCKRADRRLIAVVTGCPAREDRDDLAAALLDWGFTR
jgi:D-alanyl-D-alanine carboxypeptidase (penicillin-binding protein 5/6)